METNLIRESDKNDNTLKKTWIAPAFEILSKDSIKTGTVSFYPEGFPVVISGLTIGPGAGTS